MRATLILCCVLGASSLASAAPPILAKIPQEATFLLVVDNPRLLLESVTRHDIAQRATKLPQAVEFLNSTNAQRFFQLLSYYEREAGLSWPELVDALVGEGFAIAADIRKDPAPVLFVAEARNPETASKVFKLAITLLEAELARNADDGSPAPKLIRGEEFGVTTYQLGEDFQAAQFGKTTYISNRKSVLRGTLQLAQSGDQKKTLASRVEPKKARELLGGDPLAWLWLDFAKLQEQQSTKDFFASTRKDLLQTLLLGSSIDAFRRTNLLAAGFYLNGRDAQLKLRLPVERSSLPAEFGVHAPPVGQPGSLPFLEPKNVLYSQSFYLDLAAMWKDRKQLFNAEVLPQLEKAEKDITRLLPGVNVGKLFEQSGPYHRFVATASTDPLYKSQPSQPLPAFALVSSYRDPEFAKSATSALRAGGLVASLQFGLKMSQTTHDGVEIVTYRFPEKRLDDDPEYYRFNFAPSFAIVGENLVVSSQPGLIEDLIPELRKPVDPKRMSPVLWRGKLYGDGAAGYQNLVPESAISQMVLSQGITLGEARKQLDQLGKFIEQLGTATIELDHGAKWFEIQATWKPK